MIKLGDCILMESTIKENVLKYADVSLGGTPSRKHPEYWNGKIKWINSGAITGTPAVLSESEFITLEGVKHSATKAANTGDCVLSIIEPSKDKVSFVLDDEMYFNQSVICLASKAKHYQGLIFFASKLLIDEIKGYATGAAQQSLNKDMIEKSSIMIPNPKSINKLNDLLDRMIALEKQIRYLKNIKVDLLSKYF